MSQAFPSETQLAYWEQTYAGPHTLKLESHVKHELALARYNTRCLVCLQKVLIPHNGQIQRCEKCPRVMHIACLKGGVKQEPGASAISAPCPLCVRRGWHVIEKGSPLKSVREHGDDWVMARAVRMMDWKAEFEKNETMNKHAKLTDDGSVECDRQILAGMGLIGYAPEAEANATQDQVEDRKKRRRT